MSENGHPEQQPKTWSERMVDKYIDEEGRLKADTPPAAALTEDAAHNEDSARTYFAEKNSDNESQNKRIVRSVTDDHISDEIRRTAATHEGLAMDLMSSSIDDESATKILIEARKNVNGIKAAYSESTAPEVYYAAKDREIARLKARIAELTGKTE